MRATCLAISIVAALTTQATADPVVQALTAPAKVRDRVMVARWGVSGLDPDALEAATYPDSPTNARAFPVVSETRDAVRVLVEHDDARLLVWIAADDLAWTVTRSTRLLGTGAVGVWVKPGAPLEVSGDGARVAARLDADGVTVEGTVARAALTHRFRPVPVPHREDGTVRALLRSPAGPALVAFADPIAVRIVTRGTAGWVLVEHDTATVRVVGWVRRADLTDELSLDATGVGLLGYGMSDTAQIHVDAGACLYDPRGAIVGVQLQASERYAVALSGGRWSVYVGTPWRTDQAIVIDRHAGRGTPAWQRCR